MNARACAWCNAMSSIFAFLLLTASAEAVSLSVSPSSIEWTSNAWIHVSVSNIPSGAEVELIYALDLNSNAVYDPGDQVVVLFDLQDGRTNALGADIIVDDDDGTTNGAVHSRVSFHGSSYDPIKGIGRYVWSVLDKGTMTRDNAAFEITQSPTPVWITGNVRNYFPPSNAVAGARVEMEYRFQHTGPPVPTWTDTNGNFKLYVPSNVPLSSVEGVFALGLGYVSAESGPTDEPFSGHIFTNALTAGENALSSPLYVASAAPGMLITLSGTVYDPDGAGLPAALVGAELDSDDSGDLISISITDTNGNFALPYPTESEADVHIWCADHLLGMRGYVGVFKSVMATADISGIELTVSNANVIARNKVVESGTLAGIAGVEVEFESDTGYGGAYSRDDGIYETVLLAGSGYYAGLGEDSLRSLGYASSVEYDGLNVPAGSVFTDAFFIVESGYVLSGTVYDQSTNALGGGRVEVRYSNTWDWVGDVDVGPDGLYELLVGSGTYRVTAWDFDGFLGQVYSSYYTWDWVDDSPQYDPVIITTADVAGINFFLEPAAEISGTVLADAAPLVDADVVVYTREWQSEGWWDLQYIASGFTDTGGMYTVGVPAGTDYVVEARSPQGSFWVGEYYNDVYLSDNADPVATAAGAPAANIDFTLTRGGMVTGTIYETDGSTPVPYAWIELRPPGENYHVFGNGADHEGRYSVTATAGVYNVIVYANGWPDQYYNGWSNTQQENAEPVTVVQDGTTNVTFRMLEMSSVEGHVRSGTDNLGGIDVLIWRGSEYELGRGQTGGDGSYSIPVLSATGCIAWARPGSGSTYIEQVWSNASWDSPTYFDIPVTSTVTGIDFDLTQGMRVEGHVQDEHAAPLAEVDVALLDTNGMWMVGGRTDSSGDYFMIGPAARDYIVQALAELPLLYPEVYYSGVQVLSNAAIINQPTGTVVSGIDFTMIPGYKVEGYIYTADGSTPAPGGFAYAEDAEGRQYGWVSTDGSGWYERSLPRHRPLCWRGTAQDHQSEYHFGTIHWAQAVQLQPAAGTTSRLDFVLYHWNGDADNDGIPDYMEDVRPDGSWNPADDASSWTNRDTDVDGFDDYVERYVIYTDPADASDNLQYVGAEPAVSGFHLSWRSETGVVYKIQRTLDLVTGIWTNFAEVPGTGKVTTVFYGTTGAKYNYRVMTE